MSSLTFTPSTKISASSNPRDWAYELALLPTSANIVFTKETFLAFLKTHNIDVSPNYTEINKLPRYAQIGTLSSSSIAPDAPKASDAGVTQVADQVAALSTSERPAPTPAAAPAPVPAVQANEPSPPSVAAVAPVVEAAKPTQQAQTQPAPATDGYAHDQVRMHNASVITPDGNEFRPTRRVREPIGGGSALISALFGSADEDEANIAEATRENARRRGLLQETTNSSNAGQPAAAPVKAAQPPAEQDVPASANTFRPTRRVREPGGTGGSSSITLG